MSKTHIEKITCPECDKIDEFVVWDSINTTKNPEMKEKCKKGELFRWTCPDCGCKVAVDFATLYNDEENQVMVYYVPGNPEDMIPYVKHSLQDKSGKKRVVGSKNQFQEKIKIFEAGLDDKKIELMKLFASTRVKLQDKGFELSEMLFDKLSDGTECFALHLKNGKWQYMEFDQALYQNVSKVFQGALEKDNEILIDFGWAVSVMQRQKR